MSPTLAALNMVAAAMNIGVLAYLKTSRWERILSWACVVMNLGAVVLYYVARYAVVK